MHLDVDAIVDIVDAIVDAIARCKCIQTGVYNQLLLQLLMLSY